MTAAATILVAGDEALYLDLSEQLPGAFRIVYCDTIGDTLDRAPQASVLLVDASISGGWEELLRRVKNNPTTSNVPLLLRSATPVQSRYADAVLRPDLQLTIEALSSYCPDIKVVMSPAQAAQQKGTPATMAPTDDRETTVWRPPSAAADWPPPPPQLQDGDQIPSFISAYEDYVGLLVRAHENPASITAAQHHRLAEMSQAVMQTMEPVLHAAQLGVNEALRTKDLKRMRELSAAKTALFARLQRLRSILRATGALETTPGGTPPSREAIEALGPLATGEYAAIRTANKQPAIRPQKSQLTLAAEQKARKKPPPEAQGHASVAPRIRKPRLAQIGSARRRSKEDKTYWPMAALAAIVIVGVYVFFAGRGTEEQQQRERGRNRPPVMQQVTIQQTPAGIMAHPQALDPDNDRVVYAMRWLVNGTNVPKARTARLAPAHYKPGNVVQIEVTPSDQFGSGQPMRSQELTVAVMR